MKKNFISSNKDNYRRYVCALNMYCNYIACYNLICIKFFFKCADFS